MNVGTDLKRAVKEVPPWGWGIIGIGGLYLVLHHAKSSAAAGGGTLPGPITQAQDPLNTSDPSGGMSAYIESLNSGYVSSAEIWSNALANLQDSNAQLMQQGQYVTPPPADYVPPSGGLPPGVIQPTVPAGGSTYPDSTAPEQLGYTPAPAASEPVAYAAPTAAYVAPASPYVYPTYTPPPPPVYTQPAPDTNTLDPFTGTISYSQPISGGYVAPSLATAPIVQDPLTTPQTAPSSDTNPLDAFTGVQPISLGYVAPTPVMNTLI